MHDLIEYMGKYIVKMQKDSEKSSKLWNVEDFKYAKAQDIIHTKLFMGFPK